MAPEWEGRLLRAEEASGVLRDITRRCPTLADYEKDSEVRAITERYIEIAVAALIDLSTATIERNRWGRPATSVQSLDVVVRHALPPRPWRKGLRAWIRMRNVIDNAMVYSAMSRRLGILRNAVHKLAQLLP